jgi:hypothetical protein
MGEGVPPAPDGSASGSPSGRECTRKAWLSYEDDLILDSVQEIVRTHAAHPAA